MISLSPAAVVQGNDCPPCSDLSTPSQQQSPSTTIACISTCISANFISGTSPWLHDWLIPPTATTAHIKLPNTNSTMEILASFHVPLILTVVMMLLVTAIVGYTTMHRKRRKYLSNQLQLAQSRLRYLQERLLLQKNENEEQVLLRDHHDSSSSSTRNRQWLAPRQEVRVFMDGAFDMTHFGHFNAFRLARSLGTHLIVGINTDKSITECKGSIPLMNENERRTMVASCKFVDEVVSDCPYIMNREYLDYIITTYRIDYVVHGDDPCIVDGKDVYASAKEAGRYRSIPRTEGVSTTDIVGRMLTMTKEHHVHNTASSNTNDNNLSKAGIGMFALGQQSKFLITSLMLRLFSSGINAPSKDMRVVYIDGDWDLFHPGHVAVLRKARERGDYLIVGVHGDVLVNRYRGMNLPLMNLHERVLSVLGCRYVDDVLIDAPYNLTHEMIASLNIAEVVLVDSMNNDLFVDNDQDERYRQAKENGILTAISNPSSYSMHTIVERIQRNQDMFQAKFDRKMATERQFFEEKHQRESNMLIR